MSVVESVTTFFSYVLIAVFLQNAVFTRALGVSQLVKLVTDDTIDNIIYWALLCFIQLLTAPLAYLANRILEPFYIKNHIRPLVLVACVVVVFILVTIIINIVLPRKRAKEALLVLPLATFNCTVFGSLLITSTQSYTFGQSLGFAIGSGIGYGLAIILVSEGQRKLSSRSVPSTFRGLPANLLYIGILAMAVYGLTGHGASM